MKLVDIAEVARLSGLPASTLRHYEEKGLIESLGRRGLRRTFDPAIFEQLSLITLGRMAGFSLDEIAAMFGHTGQLTLDRSLLAAKADQLAQRIRQLVALEDGLRHAADCPAPSHLECPSFRRLLKIASARPSTRRAGAKRDPSRQ